MNKVTWSKWEKIVSYNKRSDLPRRTRLFERIVLQPIDALLDNHTDNINNFYFWVCHEKTNWD